MEQTKLPHQYDAKGNLLWVGGSAQEPWIVTTYYEGSVRAEWVGGKSGKQADIYRKLNGIGGNLTPEVEQIIQQLKELKCRAENQFAVTIFGYEHYLKNLKPELYEIFGQFDLNQRNEKDFEMLEKRCQVVLSNKEFEVEFVDALSIAFNWLEGKNPLVPKATRSSAPSEDGAEFSGSGKYSSYLKKYGFEETLVYMKKCFMSRFNGGALHYQSGAPDAFGSDLVSLSFAVMVQDMDPNIHSAGTLFTADTQSKHRGFIQINATYGPGEAVVSGRVSSDKWIYAKKPLSKGKDALIETKIGEKQERYDGNTWHPNNHDDRMRKCLSDEMAEKIAKVGLILGNLFRTLDPDSQESDFEFAVNSEQEIIITQQRAITTLKNLPIHKTFKLKGMNANGDESDELVHSTLIRNQGINAGVLGIVHGVVISIFGEGQEFRDSFSQKFHEKFKNAKKIHGDDVPIILITGMTYPWMEPCMEKTAACITTRGGQNDHTPIWCKETNIPCAVSVKTATEISDGKWITYYGINDEPIIYHGRKEFELIKTNLEGLEASSIPIRLILSNSNTARLICMQSYFPKLNIGKGSGLVRWEMIASKLRIHPMAIIRFETLQQDFLKLVPKGIMLHDQALEMAKNVEEIISLESRGFDTPMEWYIQTLARQIAGIVSPFYTDDINEPMTIRLPDFKTNEHSSLIGGRAYEAIEENPMLGDRGAGKYFGPYREAFEKMDLRALEYVINNMGYHNIRIEVPFVRTPQDMKIVTDMIKKAGIDLPVDMMFELPVNVSRAPDFFAVSHGGQIGSNDLLQLEFGLDRSGGEITPWHIEHLKSRIIQLIAYRDEFNPDFHLGLCGNLPSTNPEFAKWLATSNIDEFSVTPDGIIPALLAITGQNPEGRQTSIIFKEDGRILVNNNELENA